MKNNCFWCGKKLTDFPMSAACSDCWPKKDRAYKILKEHFPKANYGTVVVFVSEMCNSKKDWSDEKAISMAQEITEGIPRVDDNNA